MPRIGYLFLLLAGIMACTPVRERQRLYYPVDSMLNAQIGILLAEKAGLAKMTSVDEKNAETNIHPGSKQEWRQELDIFFGLETINKPTNKGIYKREDGLHDPNSNLKILSFTAQETAPVGFLRIYYEGTVEHVRKIEASFADENFMYKSQRHLVMNFMEIRRRPVLSSFTMRGGQKVILGDSVKYHIHGEVLF